MGRGCTCESPIRVQRFETIQVGLNGDDWVYASVRVRGLTRFHVALVRCVYCRRAMEMGGRPCEGRGMRDWRAHLGAVFLTDFRCGSSKSIA